MNPEDIKAARERKGWSQAELSRHCGVHPATISLFESGRMTPYPSQLEKIQSALLEDVEPDARD